MVYRTVEVEVDLIDFDTDDLIEELENRGYACGESVDLENEGRQLLTKIWQNRREGKPYDTDLDQLIYLVLGKVI